MNQPSFWIKIFLFSINLTACQNISGSMKTVEVYRSDESRQCEQNSGISLDAMQHDFLHQIHVYHARKDYLRDVMFPTVCGGATGRVNVYTINNHQLEQAQQRGFSVFQSR